MYKNLTYLIEHSAVILVILFFIRTCFAIAFVPMSIISNSLAVSPHLPFNVFRFDLQVVCYVLLLPTILIFIFAAIRKSQTGCMLSRFRRLHFSIISTLLLVISDIDIGFYSNFSSHINITFSNFFNEGPMGLIQTIWEEHRCVYEAIAFLLILSPVLLLTRRIGLSKPSSRRPPHPTGKQRLSHFEITKLSAIILLYLTSLAIGLCRSVWRFPLQMENMSVSNQKLLNDLAPNAIYMLEKVYKEKNNAFKIAKTDDSLHRYKFKSLQKVLDLYTDGEVKMTNNGTLRALQHALFGEVGDSLKQPRPNTVIIHSEDWNNYPFNPQQKNAEMYFGLECHFREDLLFRNFQSVQNGTIALLENLYVPTPFPRFSVLAYRFKTLPTSTTLPLKASNYTTTFMLGMDAAWENRAEVLPHQRLDAVYDKLFILKDYPHVTYNSVGVCDEYLFQALLDKLSKSSKKRQIIAAMATTDHPPFEPPKDSKLPPLPDPLYGEKYSAEHNHKVLDKHLTGFRYYSKALNDLFNRFKVFATVRSTILVIVGDYNVRVILNHDIIDEQYEHSVPPYVYLLPYLRKEAYNKLTNWWGSHNGILATLAPFTFRNTKYFGMGKSLLDTSVSDSIYYSVNADQMETIPTYQKRVERLMAARNFPRLVYFTKLFR